MTFTAASLLALPQVSTAQTPAPASQAQTQDATAQADTRDAARTELQRAQTALNSISDTAVSGSAKTQIASLKQYVSKLARADKASWSKDAAAADAILATLLADGAATGASSTTDPQPTGTSGLANRAQAAVPLDAETRKSLTQGRTALTAYATAMSGNPTSPASPSDASASAATVASEHAAAAAASAAPEAAAVTAQPAPASTPSTMTPASTDAAAATPAPPASEAAQQSTPASATAQPPASTATDPAAAPSTGSADLAKQELTAARNALADLTKLPAASQLSGQPREQVAQLISEFNELISTTSNWRAAYGKVDTTLTTLMASDAAAAAQPAAPTGTSGAPEAAGAAVGTSGSTTAAATSQELDPSIKTKLTEFQTHLKAFETAAADATPASPTVK